MSKELSHYTPANPVALRPSKLGESDDPIATSIGKRQGMLDPIEAQQAEAARYRSAGPRRSSMAGTILPAHSDGSRHEATSLDAVAERRAQVGAIFPKVTL